ncbi:MAG: TonB-dependent receptor [Myxococcota bacterium]
MSVLVLLSFVWGLPAYASGDAEEAEITFGLGRDAYNAADYQRALAYFLTSNRLAPNASVAFNIARCYAKVGRNAEAYRWFSLAADGLPAAKQVVAQQEIDQILPRIVVFDITTDPPGTSVYIDRKDLGAVGVTPLSIGLDRTDEARTFIFEKAGYEDQVQEKVLGERGKKVPLTATLRQIVGTVTVHAPEGTEVHQGAPEGPLVCEAPCEAKLAPGNWLLYFRKEGYRDAVRQLEVVADQALTTLVELTPNTGSVVVDASERGALIEVDGEAVGFTPTVVQAVAVGERTVRVSRPGYEVVERRVLVETDRQVVLDDLELLPLDEVTAVSRRAERIELAPSSVTVIGAEELRAFAYPTIYEALRGVRGFALGYDSIYGNAAVRGLGAPNDYNVRLLLLQDGAPLNDNVLVQGYLGYDGRVDLGGVERIEVVRGPGSVLYGTGAVSGVVNLVTEPKEAQDGTEFSVGTFDNHVLRARVQSHYNLSDAVGFRASLAGGASQGRDEVLDPKGLTPDAQPFGVGEFDAFEAGTTTGRVWLGDATVQWVHTSRQQTIPTGIYGTNFDDPSHVWVDTRSMAELRYEPALSEAARLLTRVYFNRYHYDGFLPFDGFAQQELYTGVSVGAEGRLVVESGDVFRLTAGGLAEHNPTLAMTGDDLDADGAYVDTYMDVSVPYQVFAAYALADLVPVEQVRLTAGGRLDYWGLTESLAFSPRLALVLLPTDADVVKLMAGRAFRGPSAYEVAYDSPFQAAPDVLAPETVWQGEGEYTHSFDEAWSLLVAGHGALAQSLVETVGAAGVGVPVGAQTPYVPGAVTYQNSDAPIRILGADAELRRTFQGGWMLSGFYSFLDSRYVDGVYAGELVPNVPQNSAGLKTIVPISAPSARVAFRAALEAPRRISLVDHRSTPIAVVADAVLSGSVPERGFDYAVGVYNLFNMGYAQPAGDTFALLTMPQQGRSLMANFSMRF